MNALQYRFGSAPLWLAAFVAVAAVIGWETGWGRRVTRAPEPMAVPSPQPVALSLLPEYLIEGGAAARRETIERPAFIPTRRPAPAAAQEVAKASMKKGQFLLTGTAVVDQKAIAFLRETAGGKSRTVRAGDSINGVNVTEVRADRVKLTLGDESEELVLKVAAGPRQTIQPLQPPPAVAGAPAGQPAAPVVGAQPVAAGMTPPTDSDASILERRRAARAAAAAAAAAQQGVVPGAQNVPVAPAPAASPPVPPSRGASTADAPDPRWATLYQQRGQRN